MKRFSSTMSFLRTNEVTRSNSGGRSRLNEAYRSLPCVVNLVSGSGTPLRVLPAST